MKFFLDHSKLMFYKGLIISFFNDGFGSPAIGTIFWNNGTKSQIKDQSVLNLDNSKDSKKFVDRRGIVYIS